MLYPLLPQQSDLIPQRPDLWNHKFVFGVEFIGAVQDVGGFDGKACDAVRVRGSQQLVQLVFLGLERLQYFFALLLELQKSSLLDLQRFRGLLQLPLHWEGRRFGEHWARGGARGWSFSCVLVDWHCRNWTIYKLINLISSLKLGNL